MLLLPSQIVLQVENGRQLAQSLNGLTGRHRLQPCIVLHALLLKDFLFADAQMDTLHHAVPPCGVCLVPELGDDDVIAHVGLERGPPHP